MWKIVLAKIMKLGWILDKMTDDYQMQDRVCNDIVKWNKFFVSERTLRGLQNFSTVVKYRKWSYISMCEIESEIKSIE